MFTNLQLQADLAKQHTEALFSEAEEQRQAQAAQTNPGFKFHQLLAWFYHKPLRTRRA